jgi:hypothetical protein
MFIHFENWSFSKGILDKKGIFHEGKIIKVFATSLDPRELFGNSRIKAIKVSSEPFKNEIYEFTDGVIWKGKDLEENLEKKGISEKEKQIARTLFRFQTKILFPGNSLKEIKINPQLIAEDPFGVIHGISTRSISGRHGEDFHLDIFSKFALSKLRKVLDYENPVLLVPFMEGSRKRRETKKNNEEGSIRIAKER